MNKKASVTAKTQNRTALGVLHAYAAITPGCTLDDLRAAFPNSICPDSGVKENILSLEDAEAYNSLADMSLFFVKEGEPVQLADGTAACLCRPSDRTHMPTPLARASMASAIISSRDGNCR